MLKETTGRAFTELTEEDIEKALVNEMQSFTPAQKRLLQTMLEELQKGGKSALWEALHAMSYKREPVDMRTFVKDPYYLGETCYNIFPKLLDDLEEVFSGDYNEVIFTGAIGCLSLDSDFVRADGTILSIREALISE
jgi:hypothetical protein